MKKDQKFRDQRESDIDDIKAPLKKKKKIHFGPKKQFFSKYTIENDAEEE